MPESAAYRKYTEAVTQERLAHVKSVSVKYICFHSFTCFVNTLSCKKFLLILDKLL